MEKVNRSLANIEDLNSKIDATDNYIARYLPFNFFVQSLETAKIITPDLKINKKLRE